MTPLDHLASTAAIALAVTTLSGGYLLACLLWPFAPCRACGGTGNRNAPLGMHRNPRRRAFRRCARCNGTGRRIRAGRRLWNYLGRLHHGHQAAERARARDTARDAHDRARPYSDRGGER